MRLHRCVAFNKLGTFFVCGQKSLRERDVSRTGQTLFLAYTFTLSVDRLFQSFLILGTQLSLDGFQITNRIDRVIDVNDLVGIKRTHQMVDTVHGRNVGQECVATT